MFQKMKNYVLENFFDYKIRKHYANYILQSLIIFACIAVVMLLYELFGGIIVASLGASGFIVFATPHKEGSRAKYVIGGYVCGAIVGTLFSLLHTHFFPPATDAVDLPLALICAAAAATTAFLMIVTNTEHPPAAALALGLTADEMGYKVALAALAGVIVLCLVRRLLKKWLKDLI